MRSQGQASTSLIELHVKRSRQLQGRQHRIAGWRRAAWVPRLRGHVTRVDGRGRTAALQRLNARLLGFDKRQDALHHVLHGLPFGHIRAASPSIPALLGPSAFVFAVQQRHGFQIEIELNRFKRHILIGVGPPRQLFHGQTLLDGADFLEQTAVDVASKLHPALQQNFLHALLDEYIGALLKTPRSRTAHAFHIAHVQLLEIHKEHGHLLGKALEVFLTCKGAYAHQIPHDSLHVLAHIAHGRRPANVVVLHTHLAPQVHANRVNRQATQLLEFRIRRRAVVVHHKGPLLASRLDRSLLGMPQTGDAGEHQAHQHALRTPTRAPRLVKGDHTQISENLCKSLSFPPQHRANGEKQDLQIEHQRDVFEVHDVVAETLSHLVHILRVAVLDLAP